MITNAVTADKTYTHSAQNGTLIPIDEVKFDKDIYPRQKWNTATIERYAEALESGATFPPIVLLVGTNILLDGKHRLEAHKKVERTEIAVEWHTVPEGMSPKYYAALLSSRHGDRISNAEFQKIAVEDFEADPKRNVLDWCQPLGITKSTAYRWVSHIVEREKADRQSKAWHLAQLGWTQQEIADLLGVTQPTVGADIKNSHLGKIYNDLPRGWNEQLLADTAKRLNVPYKDALAAAMANEDDDARFKRLGISSRPYDVWNFAKNHDLMGSEHPGRIPGELIAHVLYFFTQPGDLVVDPMTGSGTTIDACLLMGRRCRGYDIDRRHERFDIEHHDLSTGWPETVKKADLIFWDPPYFDKMDSGNLAGGYVEGSVSGLSPNDYLAWMAGRFKELGACLKPGATVAFLMSDWIPMESKKHSDHPGIFISDYIRAFQDAGLTFVRQIQCPLSSQQIHPDIINKFRASRRLGMLSRYLLVVRK
ncbi:MAG: DNA methyltransferase [Synergistaceae bacterium]|nr:DNA methyltransferase [Synergistaceae bacterium]